jgi:aspartate aminotransferase-like enzyme
MSYKLFIPGPIAVSEKTLRAMAQPMIGHRSTDFVALYQSIQPDLQALVYTKDPVFISTSSSWGIMEGAVRNVTAKKVLNCMNGALARGPRGRPPRTFHRRLRFDHPHPQ